MDTPYGVPSDPIVTGEVAGRKVAFVPRHGRDHRFPPHKIPYRANLWALRSLGVRQILAPTAVGSLDPAHGPGRLAIPDQLVDRTTGRIQTFYDERGAVHVPFADPYCPVGRAQAITSARAAGWDLADSGTLVVIEGPRFSTRAESQWYAAQGWSLVGMTGHPEAVLARELALCYTAVALVTDTDAGVKKARALPRTRSSRSSPATSPGSASWSSTSSRTCQPAGIARARTCWTVSSSPSSFPDPVSGPAARRRCVIGAGLSSSTRNPGR